MRYTFKEIRQTAINILEFLNNSEWNIEFWITVIGGDEKNIDPDDPANKGKITEWEAGWNVTNAIQVRL